MNKDIEKYKQQKIKEVVSDDRIKGFINDNKLSASFYIDHFSKFLNAYESIKKCDKCNGLNECSQDKVGEYMSLKYINPIVLNDVCYCRYYLKKLKQDSINNSFVYNDIPESLYSLNMDNVGLTDDVIKAYWAECKKILNGDEKKGLFVYGDLGVGKTYMCIALANSLAEKGEKVAFVKCNDFINEMRKLNINDSYKYDSLMKAIKQAKYLFLDDIGAETVSSYSRDDVLFTILDYRMENHLTTMFTSNLSKDDLLKHYTYEKNDNSSLMRARRLMERIDILSRNCYLKSDNKRRLKVWLEK